MIAKKIAFFTLTLLLCLCSCTADKSYSFHQLYAMNTFVDIQISEDNYDISPLQDYISTMENTLSRTVQTSEISQINVHRTYNVSEETYSLLQKSKELYTNTGGAFDVCSGALTDLWNIPGGNTQVPSQSDITTAIQSCGIDGLKFENGVASLAKSGTTLDLGGIAKGYAAQKCIEFLKSDGVQNAMISFGGNVAITGSSQSNKSTGIKGWNIGIKNPDNPSEAVCVLTLCDKVVAVSGDYERYFIKDGKRYCHIFDTKSGYPADSGLRSAAVVCSDGAIADGLSTALFVMGAKEAYQFHQKGLYDFQAVLITNDGYVLYTDGLSDCFSYNSEAKNQDGKLYKYIPLRDYVTEKYN